MAWVANRGTLPSDSAKNHVKTPKNGLQRSVHRFRLKRATQRKVLVAFCLPVVYAKTGHNLVTSCKCEKVAKLKSFRLAWKSIRGKTKVDNLRQKWSNGGKWKSIPKAYCLFICLFYSLYIYINLLLLTTYYYY